MGSTDDVTITLLMALLYSLDTSILQRSEDVNFIRMLPILNDGDYQQMIYDTLVSENIGNSKSYMNVIMHFAFGLSLANLRNATSNYQTLNNNVIEKDEYLIDLAIERKVFKVIITHLLDKDIVYK